jgi:hypothetical protein
MATIFFKKLLPVIKLPYDTAAISVKQIPELRKVDHGRFLIAIACTSILHLHCKLPFADGSQNSSMIAI